VQVLLFSECPINGHANSKEHHDEREVSEHNQPEIDSPVIWNRRVQVEGCRYHDDLNEDLLKDEDKEDCKLLSLLLQRQITWVLQASREQSLLS
jgi:hypothetical protein